MDPARNYPSRYNQFPYQTKFLSIANNIRLSCRLGIPGRYGNFIVTFHIYKASETEDTFSWVKDLMFQIFQVYTAQQHYGYPLSSSTSNCCCTNASLHIGVTYQSQWPRCKEYHNWPNNLPEKERVILWNCAIQNSTDLRWTESLGTIAEIGPTKLPSSATYFQIYPILLLRHFLHLQINRAFHMISPVSF